MPWVYDPHSGGTKIRSKLYEGICEQVESFARTRPWYPKIQLKLRFKNQFCYIDTLEEKGERLFSLCRLRHFNSGWSLALFTYGNERYELCLFPKGQSEGTIEEALKICEPFIL